MEDADFDYSISDGKVRIQHDDFQYYKIGLEIHSGLFELLDEHLLRDQFGQLSLNFKFYATYFHEFVEKLVPFKGKSESSS